VPLARGVACTSESRRPAESGSLGRGLDCHGSV